MKINQVEELVGITKKNIRFYEDQGLLNPNRNPENGYRDYNLDDVDVLMKIKLLRKLSVPIEEIRKLQEGEITFDACMENQITRLNHNQHDIEIMRELCEKIADEVDKLSDLKAANYLDEMTQIESGGARFVDIEKKDIKKKKYGSLISAIVVIAFMLGWVAIMAWVGATGGGPIPVLIIVSMVYILIIVGVVVALRQRLNEINGGEEDEASKY